MSSGSTRVQAAVQVVVREARFGGEADDLAERVDAGVGAAGGGDAERLLRELVPGGFDRALHRRLVGLNLPAGVGGAVVGHGQLEPARGHWRIRQDNRIDHGGTGSDANGEESI